MTREEQIIKKAGKESEIFYKVNDNYGDCFHGGFIDGAKWADANPQFSKEKFINKACEWLSNNKNNYITDIEGETIVDVAIIEDFCKAMKE